MDIEQNESVVRFANRAAQKEFLSYNNLLNKPIDEDSLDFKILKLERKIDEAQKEINTKIMKFSEILSHHENELEIKEESEIISQIEILPNVAQQLKEDDIK